MRDGVRVRGLESEIRSSELKPKVTLETLERTGQKGDLVPSIYKILVIQYHS